MCVCDCVFVHVFACACVYVCMCMCVHSSQLSVGFAFMRTSLLFVWFASVAFLFFFSLASLPLPLCAASFLFSFFGGFGQSPRRDHQTTALQASITHAAPHTLACVVFELLAVEQHGNFSWPHGMVDTVANARALKMHVCNTRFSVTWPFCSVTTHTTTQQGKKKTRKPRGSSCLCVVLDGHVTTCTFSIACLAVACCCCCCFCLPPLSLLSTLTNHG